MIYPLAYLSGNFVPRSGIRISPDDRGFLFGDGVYEVVRFYGGHPFGLEAHLARLERSLAGLRIEGVDVAELPGVLHRLISDNDVPDAMVYLQVTRGVAPRRHAFPDAGTPPTVYAFAQDVPFQNAPGGADQWDTGAVAVTVPDERWGRCNIKSLNLLPNILANQAAREAGVHEAIMVRDGVITEGSHTNVAAVIDGTVVTHPECPLILSGVTRAVVLTLCQDLGIPAVEQPFARNDIARASELMIFSTAEEVMPVVQLDEIPIGAGEPGPVARSLLGAFRRQATGEPCS